MIPIVYRYRDSYSAVFLTWLASVSWITWVSWPPCGSILLVNQLHHAANRLHSYAAKRLKRPYSEFPVGEIDVVAQFISLGSFEEVLHSVEKYTGCKVHPLTALFSDSSCHKDQFTVVGLKFGTQNFIYPRLLKIRRTLTGLSSWFFPEVGGGYSWEFFVGVCHPVLQILTRFQTKKCNYPYPFSDLPFRQKLRYHYQIRAQKQKLFKSISN